MLQYHWNTTHIVTNQQANDMVKLFKECNPDICAFDTETTGLHIALDKPFLFQFGWICNDKLEGYAFAVDIEKQPDLSKQVIKIWHKLVSGAKKYLGHNVKYDMHMLINLGLPYTTENVSDTMFYIRYAHDALHQSEGGPPLGLKDYAAKYIDRSAKSHEKLLDQEKTDIAKTLNNMLKRRLSSCRIPEGLNYKSFTLSALNELFKDPIAEVQDFPDDIQQAYLDWKTKDLPLYLQSRVTQLVESTQIAYNTLNRDNVIKYAIYDIVWTLEIYAQCAPVIKARQQQAGIQMEESLIFPLIEMERVGFKANKQYLETCRQNLKQYIIEQRTKLFELTQKEFSIGQHETIKDILINDFNVNLTATNASELDLILSNLIIENKDNPAIKVIQLIQELRTLEKWYSAYITRFLKDLTFTDRLYTTINQVGTVSGRVTSNFQQFPRDPIVKEDGTELFHPRRMVEITGGDYDGIVYCDYSQIELRFQAMYTILVGSPDLNLCRAYMPYKCHLKDGTQFDYTNPELIKRWKEEWYLDENPDERWEPTDVHGATTTAATGLKKGDEGFKEARYAIGKRTNFAKNYGAQYKKIRQMFPDKTEEECRKIDNAYYTAFPGVKEYHSYCYQRAMESYTGNLFNIRYYNISGHKLINMLIQGSAAYYLKWKIRQLYDYCKANGIKSRWQMQIHDELSWEKHKDDPLDVFIEMQTLMGDWSDTLVPIVAEMDATKTTWADKKGIDGLDELQNYFSN
jgi:DNA polymerase-1